MTGNAIPRRAGPTPPFIMSDDKLAYECCFCHQAIEGDITALILVTRWNGPQEKQREQQWFCHSACFVKTTVEHIDVLDDEYDVE
ncbi:MAG: hypothetical protein JSR66_24405 [Proteobacteria bacterium]|nr:hypothetical protein [Pseudomonadota bacterium]